MAGFGDTHDGYVAQKLSKNVNWPAAEVDVSPYHALPAAVSSVAARAVFDAQHLVSDTL